MHPLVLELTGKKIRKTGLEGKFSIYHAVAVALIEGAGGEKQFSDRAVNDPDRRCVARQSDPGGYAGIDPAQVDMTIVLKDGRTLHRFIAHAIGSVEVPMTDKQLEGQVRRSCGRRHSVVRDPAGHRSLLERRKPYQRRRDRENIGSRRNRQLALAADVSSTSASRDKRQTEPFLSGSSAGIGPVLSPSSITSSAEIP